MNLTSATENTLTIRRNIKAPVQQVFEAWTQPKHLKNWWFCDPNWKNAVAEVDLRAGGKYRLGMTGPGMDNLHVCHGEFIEVKAPYRLVYTWQWEEPTEYPGQSQVTVEFREVEEGTEVVIVHDGLENAAAVEAHNDGWNGCMNILGQLWK